MAEHQATRDQNERHERGKKIRDWATFAALIVAAIAAIVTIRESRRVAGEQHADTLAAISETQRLANAAQTSAEATERLSTANRAYIFVSYTTPQASIPKDKWVSPSKEAMSFIIMIKYTITNVGQTPAIITRLEAHLLMANNFYVANGRSPVPESTEWQHALESNHVLIGGDIIEADLDGTTRTFIPANTVVPIEEQFVYFGRPYVQLAESLTKWLYVKIWFTDIYRRQHWSCYYVHLTGATAVPVNGICNDWDQ